MTSKSPPVWRPYISNGPVAERLDEFPDALRDTTVYPWDETEAPICWPFGERAGEPLTAFSSNALLRMRREVEAKNGRGSYFLPLIEAIDEVLLSREGL